MSVYCRHKNGPMTIADRVLEKLRSLPAEEQQEVLNFVDSLKNKKPYKNPRRSLLGLWADLNVDITEEDIAGARREIWRDFPRDIEA